MLQRGQIAAQNPGMPAWKGSFKRIPGGAIQISDGEIRQTFAVGRICHNEPRVHLVSPLAPAEPSGSKLLNIGPIKTDELLHSRGPGVLPGGAQNIFGEVKTEYFRPGCPRDHFAGSRPLGAIRRYRWDRVPELTVKVPPGLTTVCGSTGEDRADARRICPISGICRT